MPEKENGVVDSRLKRWIRRATFGRIFPEPQDWAYAFEGKEYLFPPRGDMYIVPKSEGSDAADMISGRLNKYEQRHPQCKRINGLYCKNIHITVVNCSGYLLGDEMCFKREVVDDEQFRRHVFESGEGLYYDFHMFLRDDNYSQKCFDFVKGYEEEEHKRVLKLGIPIYSYGKAMFSFTEIDAEFAKAIDKKDVPVARRKFDIYVYIFYAVMFIAIVIFTLCTS